VNVSERSVQDADPAAPVAPPRAGGGRWSLPSLIAFRFAFVYWILYCWPVAGHASLLDVIPFASYQTAAWAGAPWRALSSWTAVHVFRLSGPVTQYHPTGSGDTTLDYVQVFCFAVTAVAATVVWSVLDRRRSDYRTLYPWLRLVVRFTLAITLLSYGFAKIYPLQFTQPMLSTLVQTYGESSPMRLLWTFMGASTAYTIFAGLAEASAGTLLLFRRTAVLGALASTGVMLNVTMLNYCYDVPVKLYSTHLFLMSVFLLLPEAPALWRFFVLHRPAELARVWLPRIERRWLRLCAAVLQGLIVVSLLGGNIFNGYTSARDVAEFFKPPPLYGVWDVDGGLPWRRIVFNTMLFMTAVGSDGKRSYYVTTYAPSKHSVHLGDRATKATSDLTYRLPDAKHLELRGKLDGKAVVIRARRYDADAFLLTTRGFHWISEDPYNR
jgi:uncharacterized membrane protein YphA (DoxX/SURF4 family)